MRLTTGERIERERVKKGLTKTQLAEKAGVTPGTIYYIEKDKHGATLAVAALIADALGVSLDYLAGRRDEP